MFQGLQYVRRMFLGLQKVRTLFLGLRKVRALFLGLQEGSTLFLGLQEVITLSLGLEFADTDEPEEAWAIRATDRYGREVSLRVEAIELVHFRLK